MDISLNRSFKLFPEGSIFRSQADSQSISISNDNENVTPAKKSRFSTIEVKRSNSISRKLFTNARSKRFLPPFKNGNFSDETNNKSTVELIPDPPCDNLSQLFSSSSLTGHPKTPLVALENVDGNVNKVEILLNPNNKQDFPSPEHENCIQKEESEISSKFIVTRTKNDIAINSFIEDKENNYPCNDGDCLEEINHNTINFYEENEKQTVIRDNDSQGVNDAFGQYEKTATGNEQYDYGTDKGPTSHDRVEHEDFSTTIISKESISPEQHIHGENENIESSFVVSSRLDFREISQLDENKNILSNDKEFEIPKLPMFLENNHNSKRLSKDDDYVNFDNVNNPLVWETPKKRTVVSTSLLNLFDQSSQIINSPVLFNDKHNTSLPARFSNHDHAVDLFDAVPDQIRNNTPMNIHDDIRACNIQEDLGSNQNEESAKCSTPQWSFIHKPSTTINRHLSEIKEEVISPLINHNFQHAETNHRASPALDMKSQLTDLQNVFLIWATQTNMISELQRQSSEFSVDENDVIPVYQFSVSIDVQHLIDFHEELGSLVLKSPLIFLHLLKQVCFNILRSDGMVEKLYSQYQIIIKPLLTNVPSIKENTIVAPNDIQLVKKYPSGLYLIRGMVIGLSSLSPYTKCAKYTCAQKDCQWSQENCYVISSNISTLECDMIRGDFPCNGCGNFLQEDIAWRKTAEQRYCFVIPKKSSENLQMMHSSNAVRCESLKIVIKDELKDDVTIGGYYWFTGIFKHNVSVGPISKQNVRINFDVISVKEDVPYSNPIKNYQRVLPDSLCSLYQDRKSSPWSFVSSLAYCFLETISPPGTYYLFKTCLLFSLLMEGDKSILNLEEQKRKYEVNNLHMLVHNEDILPYQHMMICASKFSESPVIHRVPMDLFGTITKDDSLTYVDGGSLSLSSTSVCIIPNMLELKKKQMAQLQNVFDNQLITVHIPKKQHDEVQQNQFCIPFKGFVWTCNELQSGNANPDFAIEDVSKMPPGLSSLFNLSFHEPKNSYNVDIDSAVCDHILNSSLDQSVPPSRMFIHEHFDEYITHARKQQVQMSQEAFKLIKTFYLVSRRVNTSINQISQTSLQSLLCLSAAHAKAMLRGTITVNDAVAAIYLFEQLMALCHGNSTFGVLPVIHFLNSDISKHLGPENDGRMYQLKRSVINYCSTYYPDVAELVNVD